VNLIPCYVTAEHYIAMFAVLCLNFISTLLLAYGNAGCLLFV